MKLAQPEPRPTDRHGRFLAVHGPWVILVVFASAVTALYVPLSVIGRGDSSATNAPGNDQFYCAPNGQVRFYGDQDDDGTGYWDSSLFLSVTMGFGGLSFAGAKAIDIAFDLIIGRGLQALMILWIYPVVRRAVLRSMEVREMSLSLLFPLFLERLSFFTLWALGQASVARKPDYISTRDRWHSVWAKWRLALVFLIAIYALAVPTFLSAMTSYMAQISPYLQLSDSDEYMPTANLSMPDLVITDARRFGDKELYSVFKSAKPEVYHSLLTYYAATSEYVSSDLADLEHAGEVSKLWRDDDWQGMLYNSGFNANKTKGAEHEAWWHQVQESLPINQNVTGDGWSVTLWPHNSTYRSRTSWRSFANSSVVIDGITHDLSAPPLDITVDSSYYFANAAGDTFEGFTVRTNSKCMPADSYKWGFSSLMLFTFCIVTIVVGLLVMILHYDALYNSTADQYKLDVSAYRDILDLAGELRAHFGASQAEDMPGHELEREMRQRPARASLDNTGLRDRKAKASSSDTWLRRGASTTKGAEAYLLSIRPGKDGDAQGESSRSGD